MILFIKFIKNILSETVECARGATVQGLKISSCVYVIVLLSLNPNFTYILKKKPYEKRNLIIISHTTFCCVNISTSLIKIEDFT